MPCTIACTEPPTLITEVTDLHFDLNQTPLFESTTTHKVNSTAAGWVDKKSDQ